MSIIDYVILSVYVFMVALWPTVVIGRRKIRRSILDNDKLLHWDADTHDINKHAMKWLMMATVAIVVMLYFIGR